MAANAGVRDGPFVKFPGWDLPGDDCAYYPDLKGKVLDLKQLVLKKQGNMFLAFNTNGEIRSWAVLDFKKFQKSASDLYVRVEYPGWYFVQGMDSPDNNLTQITEVNTSTGLREAVIAKFGVANNVAAFNTDGYVKSKVVYPLQPGLKQASSLAGIYIRTAFSDFNFYPLLDSSGFNIEQTKEFANEIPQLIQKTSSLTNSEGFNTDGWHKYALEGPPPKSTAPSFKEPYQGIYYRTGWPDFIFLPGMDSEGYGIRNVGNLQVSELLDAAREDPEAVAVNTSGWLKSDLNKGGPSDIPGAEDLKGIYVKLAGPQGALSTWSESNEVALLSSALFALKGSVVIWSRWVLNDANVRLQYQRSVSAAADGIIARVQNHELTPAQGAQEAHSIRNQYLLDMRKISSPLGLMIAESIKPAGGSYQAYLDKNAMKKYQKSYADLTLGQAQAVAEETIRSAGRANPNVTAVITTASTVSKGILAICAAVSVYSVTTAPAWDVELGRQVASWSASIIAGQIGVGVGSLTGPVGAVVGSIAGSLLGGLGYDALANWFYGGPSSATAQELLGSSLEPVSKLVKTRTVGSGSYIHVVRATVLATSVSGDHEAVKKMVEDIPENINPQSAASVLATIVWVSSNGTMLPANAKSPKDLITLMDYIRLNLPSPNPDF
ncbi:unnamed protein product [Clonostachys chloroleuca]|uniref:Uncharacterized protein n=1 Tax=Clonostachys chloroleuca TaxID=1926264 RepID=A0AA35LRW2_9HYPO|nr:unnamed protein product [Clonostachys chloroleuca]